MWKVRVRGGGGSDEGRGRGLCGERTEILGNRLKVVRHWKSQYTEMMEGIQHSVR